MTGSGDPAFTRNFNPYAGGGLPSNSIAQGAFYEPLIVTSGRRRPDEAVARPQLEVVERQQDAHAQPREEREVVGRQAADLGRRRLQPDRRPAGQDDGPHRPRRRRQQHRLDQGRRASTASLITLKTPDSQFIAAILNRAVRRPEAHLVEGGGPGDLHELEPRRLGPVQQDRPLHDAGLRPRARTRTTGRPGSPKIACLEYVQAASNDAALRADPERPGRLDAQLRPERREGVRGEGPGALPLLLLERATTRSRSSSTTRSTRTASSPFRKALSLAIDRKTVWKLGEYGYEPPADALGLSWLFPSG